MKPVVSIVGRPNVGKSTLFNRLIGNRKALVSKFRGLTRDRNYGDVHFEGRDFTLIDTGGLEPITKDEVLKEVQNQTELAIYSSDIILFLVDAKEGLTPIDKDIADMLRKIKAKTILVVNKVDNKTREEQIYEFFNLGIGEPLGISAEHGLNIDKLFSEIIMHIPVLEEENIDEEDLIKIALIGKPNVGKSSLINALLNEQRVIVDKIPGTTRDSVDTVFHHENDKFILIDTAGIKHKGSNKTTCELLSFFSAQRSIERADLALIILDAETELTEQDEKIAGLAYQSGCACIIVINKWDLVDRSFSQVDKDYHNEIKRKFNFLHFAPIMFTSAKTKHGVGKIVTWVKKVINNYSREVPLVDLRKTLDEALQHYQVPLSKGRRVTIKGIEQIKIKPPTFKIVVTDRNALHFSYRRYLENRLRENFDFMGTPIKIVIRSKPR